MTNPLERLETLLDKLRQDDLQELSMRMPGHIRSDEDYLDNPYLRGRLSALDEMRQLIRRLARECQPEFHHESDEDPATVYEQKAQAMGWIDPEDTND